VHPQFWPDDLDYAGKSVLVIGSGATAVTLVPALAETAAHVTMLQRSPSYVLAIPSADPLANRLRRTLGARRAYPIVRWKNVTIATLLYQLSQRRPKLMRSLLRRGAVRQLPAGYAVDTHFNPTYGPWDQRLCLVPDGDLFRTLKAGRASIVTDRIERFTPTGVVLESGAPLDADVIVTATGLNLLAIGGISLSVDGAPVSLPEHLAYKGMMLSRVPNFAFTIGYTNASWTLKADLVAEYVCRLLGYMDEHGYRECMPVDDDPSVEPRPLLDFAAGYVQRSLHLFPKGGSRPPWRLGMSYAHDVLTLRHGTLEDGALRFSAP
jgi:monooxygenase